jgi:hypothetical protein
VRILDDEELLRDGIELFERRDLLRHLVAAVVDHDVELPHFVGDAA